MNPDWQSPCGTIQLYCGDCRDIISGLDLCESSALVTDPPYGIAFKSHGQRFAKAQAIAGDESIDVAEWVIEQTRDMQQMVFFSPYVPLQVKWRSVLVWSKGAHVGIGGDRETCWKRDAEFIGVRNNKPLRGKRDSCVLQFNAVLPPPSGHFCEKPEPLMAYLVGKLDAETILDPFMGSGATGVACVRLGRRFIGIESDVGHFEKARNRIMRSLGMETRNSDGTVQRLMSF